MVQLGSYQRCQDKMIGEINEYLVETQGSF